MNCKTSTCIVCYQFIAVNLGISVNYLERTHICNTPSFVVLQNFPQIQLILVMFTKC